MYINIAYKFHRIPDTQSHFITKVHDLLGQPSYTPLIVYDFSFISNVFINIHEYANLIITFANLISNLIIYIFEHRMKVLCINIQLVPRLNV